MPSGCGFDSTSHEWDSTLLTFDCTETDGVQVAAGILTHFAEVAPVALVNLIRTVAQFAMHTPTSISPEARPSAGYGEVSPKELIEKVRTGSRVQEINPSLEVTKL